MKWRRIVWLMIALLMVVILLAGIELKAAYEELASAQTDDNHNVHQRLALLQNRIEGHRGHLANLEQLTLWEPGTDFMSWVTRQANDTDVRVIGVEHLPEVRDSGYRNIPVTVTIRGDYNPLGRFINKLEHCPRAIRINSMRIRRREYTPEDVMMELSMSYFRKGETS